MTEFKRSLDLDKIRNHSKWTPDNKAIEWAKLLIEKVRRAQWITSDYSLLFPKYPVDQAILLDLNLCGPDPFENLFRMVKILDNLGYNTDCDQMILNLGPTERRIGNKIISMNKFIPPSTHFQTN